MRNALYFPYISVPNERWTTLMLLYWDQLSSIVPSDYIEHLKRLDPYMRALVDEGLVVPVAPARFLDGRDIRTPSIQIVESQLARLEDQPSGQAPVHLHFEKMGYNLVRFLESHDLASEDRFPWYRVDARVANWYMAHLAMSLGSLQSVNAAPMTNDLRLIASLTASPVRQPVNAIHRAKARRVILDGLLPIPQKPVDVHKLAAFKREQGPLLGNFRVLIEAKVDEIAAIDDAHDRELALMAFDLETRVMIEEIREAMHPKFGMLTLSSLVGLAAGGLTAAATDMSTLSVASAAAGASLLTSMAQAIANMHPNKKQMLKRPMAYAVAAQTRFSVPTKSARRKI